MKKNELIDILCQIACKTSSYHGSCLFCDNNVCKKEMWQTFKPEVKSIVKTLEGFGLLKINK